MKKKSASESGLKLKTTLKEIKQKINMLELEEIENVNKGIESEQF